VEDASLQDVKDFFFKHYTPGNAILVVAGNIDAATVKELAEKWFGPIPGGEKYIRRIPAEPKQTAPRTMEVKANVPLDALYKAWHMSSRLDERY
jgi:zinc protease